MIDVEQRLRDELDKLSPRVPPADWQAVLALASVRDTGRRASLVRRVGLLAAALATFAVLAVATSLGATIAHGLGGFSSWLTGEPGKPASKSAQRAFTRANARSWLGFPTSTKLRQLADENVPGTRDKVDLLGFRSGSTLCLRADRLGNCARFEHELRAAERVGAGGCAGPGGARRSELREGAEERLVRRRPFDQPCVAGDGRDRSRRRPQRHHRRPERQAHDPRHLECVPLCRSGTGGRAARPAHLGPNRDRGSCRPVRSCAIRVRRRHRVREGQPARRASSAR